MIKIWKVGRVVCLGRRWDINWQSRKLNQVTHSFLQSWKAFLFEENFLFIFPLIFLFEDFPLKTFFSIFLPWIFFCAFISWEFLKLLEDFGRFCFLKIFIFYSNIFWIFLHNFSSKNIQIYTKQKQKSKHLRITFYSICSIFHPLILKPFFVELFAEFKINIRNRKSFFLFLTEKQFILFFYLKLTFLFVISTAFHYISIHFHSFILRSFRSCFVLSTFYAALGLIWSIMMKF